MGVFQKFELDEFQDLSSWILEYEESPIIYNCGLFEEHAADIDIIMENTKPKALEVQEPPRTRRSARLDQKRNPEFGNSSRSPTKDSFKRRKSGAGINESLYGGIETSDREESEAEEVEEPEVEQKVPTNLHEWNQGHFKFWLKKTSEMFNLPKIPSVQKFPKTGKELSELSRSDFHKMTGDIDTANTLAEYLDHIKGQVPNDPNCNYEEATGSSKSSQKIEETKKKYPNIVGEKIFFKVGRNLRFRDYCSIILLTFYNVHIVFCSRYLPL